MAKFSYVMRLSFKKSYELEHCLKGEMRIGSATDRWEFTGESLNINFERVNPVVPDSSCLSSTRIKRLQNLFILFYGLLAEVPEINNIVLCDVGCNKEYSISVPDEFSVSFKCDKTPFLKISDLENILIGKKYKTATTSISYIIGSHTCTNQSERFRFLWSAFNALYRENATERKAEWRHAVGLLNSLCGCDILNEDELLFRSLDLHNGYWQFSHFVSGFNPIKRLKNKTSDENKKNLREALDSANPELVKILLDVDSHKRNPFPDDNNPFKEKLSDFNDKNRSCFVFIFAIYLYWLRCDSMHGEHRYEVFESNDVSETAVKVYDIFEDVVIKALLFVCTEN